MTGTYANAAFLKANSAYDSQNTTGNYANSAFLVANTPSHVANSAAIYANGAFLAANTPTHVANSAALYANGAFAKANAALANASGTFAGDLTITGNTQAQKVNTGNLTVVGTAAVSTQKLNITQKAIKDFYNLLDELEIIKAENRRRKVYNVDYETAKKLMQQAFID